METKHTAGPWIEDDGGWICNEAGASIIEYEGCGSHKAEWPNPCDRVLVLAAPDLLRVLMDLYDHGYTTCADHDTVRAVIAKATGDKDFGCDA